MKFPVLAIALTTVVAPTLGAVSVFAAPARSATPTLSTLFYQAAQAFWTAEPKFHIYDTPFTSLPPLAKNDPAIASYRRAAQAAETFLAAQEKQKTPSDGTPVMLYFAAMSYDRLGNHEKTLLYIDRLLNEFPNYKRPRVNGDPFFDHPVRADLLILKMWHTRQLKKAPDTLETLRQMAQDAVEVKELLAVRERTSQKMPDLDRVAPTADMLRTAALPDTLTMTIQANDTALPALAKSKGAKAVRDYLRSLNQKPVDTYFGDYAGKKLVDLDKVILAGYRDEADKAIRENRFAAAVAVYKRMLEDYAGSPAADEAATGLRKATIGGYRYAAQQAAKANDSDAAKANWRKISAEFAGSSDADEADEELKKIVPVAVKFYKVEGDKNYQVDEQPGVPQIKAREYYEKMYRADPDGTQAPYALLKWSEALGTEKKPKESIQHLQQLLNEFPQNPLRSRAMFLLGYMNGSERVGDRKKGVEWMERVVKEFPNSEEAPEALWYAAFYQSWMNEKSPAKAIPYLEQIQQNYPHSPRWKHTDFWIKYFKEHTQS